MNFLWPANTSAASIEPRNASPSLKQNNRALVLFDGGPFALVNFHVGMNSNGLLQPIDVIREHILNGKVNKSLCRLSTCVFILILTTGQVCHRDFTQSELEQRP